MSFLSAEGCGSLAFANFFDVHCECGAEVMSANNASLPQLYMEGWRFPKKDSENFECDRMGFFHLNGECPACAHKLAEDLEE